MVDGNNEGRQDRPMGPHEDTFAQIRELRAAALDHARRARSLSARRRELMHQLIAEGVTQADIARELGVTRQAVQKMLAS